MPQYRHTSDVAREYPTLRRELPGENVGDPRIVTHVVEPGEIVEADENPDPAFFAAVDAPAKKSAEAEE